MSDLSGKRVVMVIASDGFRDEEFNEPYNLLRERGARVTVASSALGTRKGMLGGLAEAEELVSNIAVADYDAVVFVGGTGSSEYFDDATAHGIARDAASAGKVLGAICIAPSTLANAGVLKGRKATSYPSERDNLVVGGAEFTGAAVEVDGRIITADGPDSAKRFAEAIAEVLQ